MKKKTKPLIILGIGVLVGAAAIFFLINRGNNKSLVEDNITSVSITKSGNELTVFSDGSVVYRTADGEFFDQWSSDKTSAFFGYFAENYTGDDEILYATQDQVVVNKNGNSYSYSYNGDEIVDAAADDAQNADDGGGNDDDEGVNQYFSPTPAPTPTYVSNYSPTPTPTATPYSGEPFSDTCLYWKLSYCVIPVTPTPTTAPTGIPDPNLNVIEAGGCGDWIEGGNQDPTIISNTVCLPTPTP